MWGSVIHGLLRRRWVVCLQSDLTALRGRPVADALKPLLLNRITTNIQKLGEITNPKDAEDLLQEILDSLGSTVTLS